MDRRDSGIGQGSGTDKLQRELSVQPLQSPLRTYPSDRKARKHYRQLGWMIVMLVFGLLGNAKGFQSKTL